MSGPDDPAQRLRIARVITRLNIGGPARHALILSEGLTSEGFATTLFAGDPAAAEGDLRPEAPPFPIVSVPGLRREPNPLRDLRAFLFLLRAFRRLRPSIVHTHMAKAGTLGRLAARLAGVPLIVHTYHGHVLEGYFRPGVARFYARVERALARRSHALVAVSPQTRDELLARGIGRAEQWRVIPLGLDLDPLLDGVLDGDEARRHLGIAPGRPAVGIVGRLVPIKDHRTFLEAARIVTKERDVTFVVAGDGELRGELEQEASDLGGAVRFLGWVDDLRRLYVALDLVVLTSRNEGTPVALIEAMAAGRPVVATNVGGVPECIPEGAGEIVAPGDPEAVAVAVGRILDNPDRARAMGHIGRESVRERYRAQRLVRDVAALYRQLSSPRSEGRA